MACVSRPKPLLYFWLKPRVVFIISLILANNLEVNAQHYEDVSFPHFSGSSGQYSPQLPPVPPGRDPGQRVNEPSRDNLSPGRGFSNNQQNSVKLSNQDLRGLLNQVDFLASEQCTNNVATQWAFETNVNALTQQAALASQRNYAYFQRAVWQILHKLDQADVQDEKLWRQVKFLSVIGPAALPPDLLDRYNKLIDDMLAIYNSATICAYNEPFNCGLRLEPELSLIMARSRDWDELQHVWLEWRRKSGQQIRDLYEQLVDVSNQAAHLNNLRDYAEYWMFPYESPTFRFDIEDVWDQVRPLYEQLHAYVRRKLRDLYGPEKINRRAPLPAHILGNMWGQSWSNILDITIPYPGKNFLDVGPQMVEQGYTPLAMFRLAEEFYLSLNMSRMSPEFWANSVFEELPDRSVVCQPSAWDFCNRQDYRIKMCTHVSMKDFVTAHHEMGHIQYFLSYRDQPKVFRDGANPGFHEAVGEAIALSVATPRHLQNLGLVPSSVDDTPHNINFLFAMALDKLAFLPYSLSLDHWRWDVFQKSVSKEQYNCHWWSMREKYTGVKPPLLRSEIDFDPGSKYHVPANIPYIRYFVGTILQFQIHRSLCQAAGQYRPGDLSRPLHKCDIYRSHEAGRLLSDMMQVGSSVPWSDALYAATGETKLNGTAIREYFRPLEDWLRGENLRTQEFVGWTYDGDYCKHSIETAGLQVYGGYYNSAPSVVTTTTTLTTLALVAMQRIII